MLYYATDVFNLPLLSAILFLSSLFSRVRWSGPWAKAYMLSVICSFTSRLPRPLNGHFLLHLELGSVALHMITWQWTNTNGWSAMNLKASRLKPLGTDWRCRMVLHCCIVWASNTKASCVILNNSLNKKAYFDRQDKAICSRRRQLNGV